MSIERPTPEEITEARTHIAARKSAYQLVFSDGQGRMVLEDLSKFARFGLEYSTFHPDHRMDDMYAGRNDILKRIKQHIELPLDDLLRLFAPEAYAAMMLQEAVETGDV